ncbi:recombinase family protein [Photobacterium ganghwense]|uniref:recombinase family protein n=1 Tax=Photobacterium ganghwense TaxID=320778 RepID=UPI0040571A4E
MSTELVLVRALAAIVMENMSAREGHAALVKHKDALMALGSNLVNEQYASAIKATNKSSFKLACVALLSTVKDLESVAEHKPKVIAYVRVSDNYKQDSSTQRSVIETYANEQGLTVDEWREFNLSGSKTTSEERGIVSLVEGAKQGDIILVSDVARLGRDNIHSVLHTITSITTKGASLHFCYSKTSITPEDTNDIAKVFIALGEAYAAVKFAEERSVKAKAAIQRRRNAGLQVGRQKGTKVKSKLDDHAAWLLNQIEKGHTKKAILEMLERDRGVSVGRAQLYRWLDSRAGGKGINKDYHGK